MENLTIVDNLRLTKFSTISRVHCTWIALPWRVDLTQHILGKPHMSYAYSSDTTKNNKKQGKRKENNYAHISKYSQTPI